jgi:hypothetical protein
VDDAAVMAITITIKIISVITITITTGCRRTIRQ